MQATKVLLIAVFSYVALVVVFESMLGYFQPANESTLVITTTDREGQTHDRVLARLESNGHLYVAVNHWPRAWYRRVLENPHVGVVIAGEKRDYVAVPVSAQEHVRVDAEHRLGLAFRILTGFPVRHILRLDPR